MTEFVISSLDELVSAVRARRDALDLSHESIDHLAGLQPGYFGKLVTPLPERGFGEMSLAAVLGALGLQIAVVVLIEDLEQARKMLPRWQQGRRRSRPRQKPSKSKRGALLTVAGSGEIVGEGDRYERNHHSTASVARIPAEAAG